MDNEIKLTIVVTFLGLVLLFGLVNSICDRKGIDLIPDDDAKGLKNRIKRIIAKIVLSVIFILFIASLCVFCTDRCSNNGHRLDDDEYYDDEYYYDGHRPDKF